MIGMFLAVSLMAVPLERPVLTHAQGQVESNLNPKAKGKAGERGAWQVLPREWGKVPKTLLGQARQSESILNELLAENSNDVFEALIKYNSFKNRKKGIEYAKKVRLRALEVSLIELI
jgi:soluble lytic murein transglycosylase-like protein